MKAVLQLASGLSPILYQSCCRTVIYDCLFITLKACSGIEKWKLETKPFLLECDWYCFTAFFYFSQWVKSANIESSLSLPQGLSDVRGSTPWQHWHDLDAKPLNAQNSWLVNYAVTGKVRLSYFFFHYFRQKQFFLPYFSYSELESELFADEERGQEGHMKSSFRCCLSVFWKACFSKIFLKKNPLFSYFHI